MTATDVHLDKLLKRAAREIAVRRGNPATVAELAEAVCELRATNHAWAVRWQEQFHRAEQAERVAADTEDGGS